jgi:hypothetical protein
VLPVGASFAYVNVEFRQALIAPTKCDGRPWDGFGSVDPAAAGLVARALGASNPYAAVVSVLANPTMAALEKPEPFGTARLMLGGVAAATAPLETAAQDTLTPIWNAAPLKNVPLAPSTRIEIELWDRDIADHDPIGTGTVTYQDLVAALQAGTVYHVRLAEQTNLQVLFFDVSVYPAT